jgi:glycosyltransferase involved in cell wall biosynthesis
MIVHNRLELTKQTIESYRATVSVPHFLLIVDNDSDKETRDYLLDLQASKKVDLVLFEPNLYPGKACNMGWQVGVANYTSATHLMRADNDMEFREGWCNLAMQAFKAFPKLGQLGLMNQEQEDVYHVQLKPRTENGFTLNFGWGNVGGTMIIPRELYDDGARYDTRKWWNRGTPTEQEDCLFSLLEVKERGFEFAHLMEPVVHHLGDKAYHHLYPEYYKRTHEERGYAIDIGSNSDN